MPKRAPLEIMFGISGRALDARMIAVLREVATTGSVAAAARNVGLSYRHAWGELGRLTEALGMPAVDMERGRGAALSAAGAALLALHGRLESVAADAWPRMPHAAARGTLEAPSGATLRVWASHDYAVLTLRDLALGHRLEVDLQIQGSYDALRALTVRKCDIAGFHFAVAPATAAGLGPLAEVLRSRNLRLIEVATRQQGLMVAPASKRRVTGLRDLTRKNVRFVNRQAHSGTRLLLDRLLAGCHVKGSRIGGYADEEFTHAAVAATVASGKAQAGFGIEAAARQQGLHFIALATERYMLAARAATLEKPAAQALLRLLASAAFTRALAAMPGYGAPTDRTPLPATDAFRETPGWFR